MNLLSFMLLGVVGFVCVLMGWENVLGHPGIIVGTLVGLIVCARQYAFISEDHWFKKWFGAVQIAFAVAVMIVQMFRMRTPSDEHDFSWRWSTMIGALAILGKGFKDYYSEEIAALAAEANKKRTQK